jgi:Ca2+-binding EF-hand superfamily protein
MDQARIGFETALKYKLTQKASSHQNEEAVFIKCFKHFDTDADGLVDLHEWVKAIEKIGIVVNKENDLEYLFEYYDTLGAGKIDYKKFADVVLNQKPLSFPIRPIENEEDKEATDDMTTLEKLRIKLVQRNIRGLIGLAKAFKTGTKSKISLLDFSEFKKCMEEMRLGLTDQELADIFLKFQHKKTNKMKPETLLHYLNVCT